MCVSEWLILDGVRKNCIFCLPYRVRISPSQKLHSNFETHVQDIRTVKKSEHKVIRFANRRTRKVINHVWPFLFRLNILKFYDHKNARINAPELHKIHQKAFLETLKSWSVQSGYSSTLPARLFFLQIEKGKENWNESELRQLSSIFLIFSRMKMKPHDLWKVWDEFMAC